MADKRYTAIFDAQDRVSDKLKRIEHATTRARDAQGRFVKATQQVEQAQDRMRSRTDRTVSSIDRLKRAASAAGSGFSSLERTGTFAIRSVSGVVGGLARTLTSLPALIAGAGAAFGAWKLGDAVIGGALRQEMAKTQLSALAGSEQIGAGLYQMVRGEASNSTFSSQDYTQATRSYLGFSKDQTELKDMLKVTEKLALLDPVQGFDGASFALKEAMSGDLMSLSERFELPKSVLRENGFDSNASYAENLKAVDRTLMYQGMDEEAVEKFKQTGLAQLMAFKAKSMDWLGQMGQETVEEIKPVLKELNAFFSSDDAIKFAKDVSGGLGDMFERALSYVDSLNLSWADVETWAKDTWAGAAELMEAAHGAGKELIDLIAGEDNASLADAFTSLGQTMEGIAAMVNTISTAIDGLGKAGSWAADAASFKWLSGGETLDVEGRNDYGPLFKQFAPILDLFSNSDGSHMGGLSYVPTDGYKANLHKGERVLTASENRSYSQGGGGQVLITGNTFNVRKESDVDAVARAIVRELDMRVVR